MLHVVTDFIRYMEYKHCKNRNMHNMYPKAMDEEEKKKEKRKLKSRVSIIML